MYQYDKHLDFHALGREIKRKREEKGWTQEYLAQLVNRPPRSIMYIENRGQYPSFDTFYQLVTLLEISVDQFFFPDKLNGESTCRKQIDVMLNSMNEKELTVDAFTETAIVRREISSSTSQTTPSSSQTPLCSFGRCRPKSARFVAPPLPTKSCDFVGHPKFGTNCPEVLLSLRHLLSRVQPFSLK